MKVITTFEGGVELLQFFVQSRAQALCRVVVPPALVIVVAQRALHQRREREQLGPQERVTRDKFLG